MIFHPLLIDGSPTMSVFAQQAQSSINVSSRTRTLLLESFDFGSIVSENSLQSSAAKQFVRHRFSLKNSTLDVITISRLLPTCDCIKAVIVDSSDAQERAIILSPGQQVDIDVVLDLSKVSAGRFDKDVLILGSIQPSTFNTTKSSGSNNPKDEIVGRIALKGNTPSAITIIVQPDQNAASHPSLGTKSTAREINGQPVINFGSVGIRSENSFTVTVRGVSSISHETEKPDLVSGLPWIKISTLAPTGSPSDTLMWRVELSKDRPIGAFFTMLRFALPGASSERPNDAERMLGYNKQQILVAGNILGTFSTTPQVLSLGDGKNETSWGAGVSTTTVEQGPIPGTKSSGHRIPHPPTRPHPSFNMNRQVRLIKVLPTHSQDSLDPSLFTATSDNPALSVRMIKPTELEDQRAIPSSRRLKEIVFEVTLDRKHAFTDVLAPNTRRVYSDNVGNVQRLDTNAVMKSIFVGHVRIVMREKDSSIQYAVVTVNAVR